MLRGVGLYKRRKALEMDDNDYQEKSFDKHNAIKKLQLNTKLKRHSIIFNINIVREVRVDTKLIARRPKSKIIQIARFSFKHLLLPTIVGVLILVIGSLLL